MRVMGFFGRDNQSLNATESFAVEAGPSCMGGVYLEVSNLNAQVQYPSHNQAVHSGESIMVPQNGLI